MWDRFKASVLDPLGRALSTIKDSSWLRSRPMMSLNLFLTKVLAQFKIPMTSKLTGDFREQVRFGIRCFLLNHDGSGNFRQDQMRDFIISIFSGTAHFLKLNHEAERDEAKQINLEEDEELSLYHRQRWEIKTLYSQ